MPSWISGGIGETDGLLRGFGDGRMEGRRSFMHAKGERHEQSHEKCMVRAESVCWSADRKWRWLPPRPFVTQSTQKTRDAQPRTGHFDWQGGGANPVSPLSTSKWVFCLDICRFYHRLMPTEAPWDCDPKKKKKPNPQSPSVSGVSPIIPSLYVSHQLAYVFTHTGLSPAQSGWEGLEIKLRFPTSCEATPLTECKWKKKGEKAIMMPQSVSCDEV